MACFLEQTHTNKELVLVYQGNDVPTLDSIFEMQSRSKGVRIIFIHVNETSKMTLGELRNLSIERSNGDFFCQWDDDDWYHRDRLKIQISVALETQQPVTMLTNIFLFDEIRSQAYLSTFRLWEGSVLCKREVFGGTIRYATLDKKEDTPFVNLLLANSSVYPIVCPFLYVYNYHGNNTYDPDHFNSMFGRSQKLNGRISKTFSNIVNGNFPYSKACALIQSKTIAKSLNYFYEDKLLLEGRMY